MRKLNKSLLNSFIQVQGDLGKEKLAVESKISFDKIGKMLRGKKIATELEMDSLCRVTGYSKDDLFPDFEAEKEIA